MLSQCGHAGVSSPRTSNSIFRLHFWQEYSYKGIVFGSLARGMYMDTFDAINQRRSVKAFDLPHRFTPAEETKLVEAALQSPTSFNMQNWRFVIVRNT